MNLNQQPQGSIPRPIEPRGFFTGVKIRPIITGAVVDYAATYALVTLYLIFVYMKEPLEEGGVPAEALQEALKEMLSSQEGLLDLLIIGALCTILGGYIAGWIARTEEIKHGALVGAVSLIIGLVQTGMAGEASPVPYWHELLGYLLAIPAGALGGSLAQRRARPSIPRNTQERRL